MNRKEDQLELVRPNEAARLLGVSRQTLWRLSKRPEFPRPFRLGVQAIGWRKSELSAFLETRRADEALPTAASLEEPETIGLLLDELARAKAKFPTWPTDVVHAAAVVVEEAGELQRAALQVTYEGGSWADVKKEAVQVGAMALRFLLHLSMLETRQSEQKARDGAQR